jgi:hypothetical protein
MVAPVIVAAIPTILEIGGKLIERLFPDPQDAAQAKLKLFELQQSGQLAELDAWVKAMQADVEDRASARQREAQTGDTRTPQTLAAVFTVGFFGVLGWLLVSGAPAHGSEALLVLLGALSAGQAAILSYYFGSSSSSRTKNDTIQRLVGPQP